MRVEPDRLDGLCRQLGEDGAEDVICRAIEDLARRLSLCERQWRLDDRGGLRKTARSMIAIADQVGMATLARVARDVTDTADSGDPPALAATLFRLIRIGEKSLTAIWDSQDLSV